MFLVSVTNALRISSNQPDAPLRKDSVLAQELTRAMYLTQKEIEESEAEFHLIRPLQDMIKAQTPVVYFMGDSTVRNLFAMFCFLLTNSTEVLNSNDHRGMGPSCKNEDSSAFYFSSWESWDDIGEGLQIMLKSNSSQPTSILTNSGLHSLWLPGVREKLTIEGVNQVVHYKTALKRMLDQFIQVVPQTRIVVMTTHSICESKWHGQLHSAAELVNSEPERAAKPCVDKLKSEAAEITIGEIQQFCTHAFFTRKGVMWLNQYAKDAVKELASDRIFMMDAFELTDCQCDYTDFGDGRHYNRLILPELKLFVDALKRQTA